MKTQATIIIFIAAFLIPLSGCWQSSLTKQQILDIAAKEAASQGVRFEDYNVYYDEKNVESKGKLALISSRGSGFGGKFKALSEQDYQAVIYKRKDRHTRGVSYRFFINKKTGNVAAVVKEK